jgi:hypothetical protein
MTFGEAQSQPERDSKKGFPAPYSYRVRFLEPTADDSRLRSSLISLRRQKANVFTPSLDKK